MHPHTRMSPLTALFLGIFGVGGVAIGSGAAIVLYGMRIVDDKASSIISFAGNTIEGLPGLIESLPPTLGDVLNDRRAPDYASNFDIEVRFTADEESHGIRPVLTIVNKGGEVVSLLAVRVAALDGRGLPVRDWTEVVATPIAIDDHWRGPLMPGSTRYVVLNRWRSLPVEGIDALTGAVEISDVRVWQARKDEL